MTTYLAYHREHVNGPFTGNDFFTNRQIESGADCFVVSSTKPGGGGKVTYRLEGKFGILSAGKNITGKYQSMDWHLMLNALKRPKTPITLDGNPAFDRNLFHDNFTSGAGFKAMKNEMAVFTELFQSILGETDDLEALTLLKDLNEIDSEQDLDDPTERIDNRLSRIGQGKFRRNVIETWGGEEKCAVTGISITSFLNASHIISWCDDVAQRKLGCNGILLSAHIDRLFDRHLIGFESKGNSDVLSLVVAPRLNSKFSELAQIGITKLSTLDLSMVKFRDRSRLEVNMRAHLDQVLETHL